MAWGQSVFLLLSRAPSTLLTCNNCTLKASNFKKVDITELWWQQKPKQVPDFRQDSNTHTGSSQKRNGVPKDGNRDWIPRSRLANTRIDVLNYQNKLSQDDDQTTLTMWYRQVGAGSRSTYTYFHQLGSLPNPSVIPVLLSSSIPPASTLQLSSLHNSPRICTIHTKTHAIPSP